MSDPTWVSYVGAVTGSIGAVTGIAGAVMGFIGYRRSGELKAIDLRLELRKTENSLRVLLANLPKLIEDANASRTAVFAATGRMGSGVSEMWFSDYQRDLEAAEALGKRLPEQNNSYDGYSHSDLESKLVLIDGILSEAGMLQKKYQASLAEDDAAREQIRADVRARTH